MNIEQFREYVGKSDLTSVYICKLWGISHTTVYRFINGGEIKFSTLEQIAKILNVSVKFEK